MNEKKHRTCRKAIRELRAKGSPMSVAFALTEKYGFRRRHLLRAWIAKDPSALKRLRKDMGLTPRGREKKGPTTLFLRELPEGP